MAGRDTVTAVIVVGAGPVGLLLAGDLRQAGVPVVVLDRLPAPMTESRASQLSTLTAELLHERGLDALLAEAVPEPRGHLAGLPLDLSRLPSDHAGNWKVPQYRTEAALAARAEHLGAVLLRGHELTGIAESPGQVLARGRGPTGEFGLRARYLVGCDGAGSTVRRLAGFPVTQRPPTHEMLRADVTGLDVRDRRFERNGRGLAVAATRAGVTRVMVAEFGGEVVARTGPPPFEEVVLAWKRVTGEDISGGAPVWVDSFDNARGLAGEYRRGRVLLAGDAAHWHLPVGGQALNTGLQEAVNLGWKLAGAVRGWSAPGLLDSYHAERHPVARRVLDSVAAQDLLLLGGPEVEPLRAVLADLLRLPPVADRLAREAAGLDIRYGAAGHPLTGRRLPRVRLTGPSGPVTPADLVADGVGTVLRLTGPGGGPADSDAGRTISLTSGCRLRITAAAPADAGTAAVLDGVGAVLLRPDGYVAWAGTDEKSLDFAIARWFGAPLFRPW
jgi:2-polyprenyl-6-methoxyphenol hydroxylase-like FAD-dependent oxidoreductase